MNRFVSFNGYQHKVIARHNGRDYFLPLGLTLINKFFGFELNPSEVQAFLDDPNPESLSSTSTSTLNLPPRRAAIFDAFFRNYTSKQWNKPPEEIDPSIIRRVPVRNSYDVNYFNDYWQGIPTEGYNALFDYKHGALPWRTLRFETERVPVADAQGTSVVNYVDADVPFTRQHEFKHYHPEPIGPLSQAESIKSGKETILMREYSATWKPGDEPYYPVNNDESAALLKKYQEEAAKIPNLIIGGRLGQYKYFDMDKSIAAALILKV